MKKAARASSHTKAASHGDARECLLTTAMRLFAEKGFDAVSVRDICSKSKTNISLVSYYFGGKEGLYKSVLQEHMSRFRSQLEAAMDRFGNEKMTPEVFQREIRAIVEVVVQLNMDHPEIGPIMLRERIDKMPHAREIHMQTARPLAERLERLMEDAATAGILRDGVDGKAFFLSLFEAIWGFLTMHRCMPMLMKDTFKLPRDKDAYIDFVSTLFVQGVLA